MQMKELVDRVRAYTRDTTGTLFPVSYVKSFINEGVDKFRQIKQLEGMKYLNVDADEPILLPAQYHYALAMYGASRCFSQDEQHYLAQTFMDDFLNLFNLIELSIKDGTIVIVDEEGNTISDETDFDGVKNVYFNKEWF